MENTLNNEDLTGKPWLFQPGNKFGKGRPKGTFSLKTFAKKYLEEMNDEEKLEFMRGLPKEVIWKMSEGAPDTKNDHTTNGKDLPTPIMTITNVQPDNSNDTNI